MLNDFIHGAKCALSGFSLIRRPGVKRFVVIPLTINILLFAAAIFYGSQQIGLAISWLVGSLPWWLQWASAFIDWFSWIIFGLLSLIILFYTFTIVANVLSSPFNSYLAEKVEVSLRGYQPPSAGKVGGTFTAIINSIRSEMGKLLYFISRLLPMLIISVIPGLNIFAPALWFIFGAWMLALEYMDYPMGNHEMNFREQRRQLKQHRALVLGFGSVIMFMTMVPILNFLAMPVAVAGATKLWVTRVSTE